MPWYLVGPLLLIPAPLYVVNARTEVDQAPDPAYFAQSYSAIYALTGLERVQEERLEAAEESLRGAIELWDGNHLAWLSLGNLLATR